MTIQLEKLVRAAAYGAASQILYRSGWNRDSAAVAARVVANDVAPECLDTADAVRAVRQAAELGVRTAREKAVDLRVVESEPGVLPASLRRKRKDAERRQQSDYTAAVTRFFDDGGTD